MSTVDDLTQSLQGVSLNSGAEADDHVADFFLTFEFPGFTYDPRQPPAAEFDRLCTARQWGPHRINTVRTFFEEAVGRTSGVQETSQRNTSETGDANSPLRRFFSAHTVNGYTYRWRSPPVEWQRLLKAKGWRFRDCKVEGTEQHALYQIFLRVVEEELDYLIEENEEVRSGALQPWELLCRILGVGDAPLTKSRARKLLRPIHVNIYDFIDHQRALRAGRHSVLRTFPTVKQLARYSYHTGRIYPLKAAKADGMLRFLLRKISMHL